MDRWVVAIVACFAMLIGVYAAFFVVSSRQPLEIDPAYQQEAR